MCTLRHARLYRRVCLNLNTPAWLHNYYCAKHLHHLLSARLHVFSGQITVKQSNWPWTLYVPEVSSCFCLIAETLDVAPCRSRKEAEPHTSVQSPDVFILFKGWTWALASRRRQCLSRYSLLLLNSHVEYTRYILNTVRLRYIIQIKMRPTEELGIRLVSLSVSDQQ